MDIFKDILDLDLNFHINWIIVTLDIVCFVFWIHEWVIFRFKVFWIFFFVFLYPVWMIFLIVFNCYVSTTL